MSGTTRTVRRRWWWTLWTLLAAGALGIAAVAAAPYLSLDPDRSTIPLNPDVAAHYLTIVVHGFPGIVALAIGPLQFVTRLRTRHPRAHRVAGRVYMIAVLFAAAAAVAAAMFSISGAPAQVAFYVMAAAWTYTLVQGYRTIRRGDVRAHRVWMIRNYALTFAAVTLRLYLLIGGVAMDADPSLTFEDVYYIAVWGSFLGNVLVAEYFIVHRARRPTAPRTRNAGAAA